MLRVPARASIQRQGRMMLAVGAISVLSVPVSAAFWIAPASPPQMHLPTELAVLDAQVRTGADLLPDDPHCDHRDLVAASLMDDYGESVSRLLKLGEGRHIAFWEARHSGSWTVVYTRADGVACVVDSGDGWSSNDISHPLPAHYGQMI